MLSICRFSARSAVGHYHCIFTRVVEIRFLPVAAQGDERQFSVCRADGDGSFVGGEVDAQDVDGGLVDRQKLVAVGQSEHGGGGVGEGDGQKVSVGRQGQRTH